MTRGGHALEGKITVVADLHLEYSRVVLDFNGRRQAVSKRAIIKRMLEHLSSSRMIIFNGDTAELRHEPVKEAREGTANGLTELRWLFQELKNKGLDSKTVYITGNHDYNIRRYPMPVEVHVTSHCVIATGEVFTLVTHGDIGPYAAIVERSNRGYAVPDDLVKYRKALRKKAYPPLPEMGEKWWLVCGHYHNPCRKPNQLVLGLPCLERYADPENKGHLRFAAIDTGKGSIDLMKFPVEEWDFKS